MDKVYDTLILYITNNIPEGGIMKRKVLTGLALLAMISGSFITQASATVQDEEFRSVDAMTVSEFETQIESKASNLTFIEFQVDVPGESAPQTFGVLGQNLTLEQAIEEANISIQDILQAESTGDVASKKRDSTRYGQIRNKLLTKKFKISSVEGKSKSKLWNTSKKMGRKEKVISASPDSLLSAQALPTAAAVACGTWRPNFHANIAANSTYQGQRYDQLKFAFTQGQLDQFACTGSTGFEPDLVTDNYDSLHYFGSSIVAYTSTMPNSYLDTNFGDGVNERVYTVGTYDVSALEPWLEYANYIRTGVGNTNKDRAKVVWQRNSTLFFGCREVFGAAWCSNPDESKIEYVWKFPLPGTLQVP
jgi:hypothetical protein